MKKKLLLGLCLLILNFEFETINCFSQNSRLWATYCGGTGEDLGCSVATDVLGNVFFAGYTNGSNGIAFGGFQNVYGGGQSDAFLVKYNASGMRLWSTYYGGVGEEQGLSVATDAIGNVYLSGYTGSSSGIASGGFQNVYGGGQYDAFLVKFDGFGNRLWATYYGGTGFDQGQTVTTDVAGNIYLTGLTTSSTGIASGGFQNNYSGNTDAFLVKFDTGGNRLWATYYGETGDDRGTCVATDVFGNAYLAGFTNSSSGITSVGFQNITGGMGDAFLVKFNAAGIRQWATYYGGASAEYGWSVATDNVGNVYLAGVTYSPSGISSGGFQNIFGGGVGKDDAFLVKFDASGNRFWATYYGAADNEEMSSDGLAIDAAGNVHLSGDTYSTGSSLASGGFLNSLMGAENEFLVTFDPSGNRICATYYGHGPIDEEYGGIAVDGTGNIYLGGTSRSTSGIASGGFQNSYGGGGNDAFLVKFTSCSQPPQPTVTAVLITNVKCNGECTGAAMALPVGSTQPYSYNWNNGQTKQTVTTLCAGTYAVVITDALFVTATATVTISEPPVLSVALTVTYGDSTMLNASGGGSYLWTPLTGLTCSTCSNPTVRPISTSEYCVTVTDTNDCSQSACITVVVDTICTEIFIPTAFSPNEDATNNIFCIYGTKCVRLFILNIYNRWGNKVFETSDPKACWNGRYKGKINEGIFVYYFNATLKNNEVITRKGNITLVY